MTLATGIGSHPGTEQRDFDEAVRIVLGELPDLPYLPEVPGRGAHANMIGRAVAILSGLGADLRPAGWRLTDAPGIDQRRARSLLARDLDHWEEETQGYTGLMKIQVTGPWTLAATMERPRGDRVLADHGARRELAESLAEGVAAHIADARRRVPGAELLVQIDEPALPAVLAGAVPTASGFSRHRSVDAPVAALALELIFNSVRAAGAEPVVHCCASDVPFDLFEKSGAPGLSIDLDQLSAADYDAVAIALEKSRRLLLGVIPPVERGSTVVAPNPRAVAERVLRFLDLLSGIEPAHQLILTPACGMGGVGNARTRDLLALVRDAARYLTNG